MKRGHPRGMTSWLWLQNGAHGQERSHGRAVGFCLHIGPVAKLRQQQPDGVYAHKTGVGEPFNSQEYFYDQAYSGAWALPSPEKPRKHPKPVIPAEERTLSPAPEPAADRPGEKRGLRAWLSRLLGR